MSGSKSGNPIKGQLQVSTRYEVVKCRYASQRANTGDSRVGVPVKARRTEPKSGRRPSKREAQLGKQGCPNREQVRGSKPYLACVRRALNVPRHAYLAFFFRPIMARTSAVLSLPFDGHSMPPNGVPRVLLRPSKCPSIAIQMSLCDNPNYPQRPAACPSPVFCAPL